MSISNTLSQWYQMLRLSSLEFDGNEGLSNETTTLSDEEDEKEDDNNSYELEHEGKIIHLYFLQHKTLFFSI